MEKLDGFLSSVLGHDKEESNNAESDDGTRSDDEKANEAVSRHSQSDGIGNGKQDKSIGDDSQIGVQKEFAYREIQR